MLLEILLHHEAAHGMADQHRRRGQAPTTSATIGDVVGNRQAVEPLAAAAAAVSGEADGIGGVTGLGKERQEVLLPAPGAGEGAMHEEQRQFGLAVPDGSARQALRGR